MNRQAKSGEILRNVGLDLLKEGKTIRIKAHGYSMYPCIKPGSLILIEPIGLKGNPVKGEIVAVRRENGLVVHRIEKIIKQGFEIFYITRGDSNSMSDNPVKISKIAGRIVRAEATGENTVPADIRINPKPAYITNRIKVIILQLKIRIKRYLQN